VLTLVDSASLAAEPVVCSNVWSHDLFTTVAFLADRTNGRAYATVLRLSVCLSVRLSVRRL